MSGTALALNNRGEIVGESVGPSFHSTAVLWQGGVANVLPPLPSEDPLNAVTFATDINDHGQIVGASSEGGGQRAVMWQEGQVTALPTLPGHTLTHARAINNRGIIVGATLNPEPPFSDQHAAIWQYGSVSDLNDLIVNDPAAAFITVTEAADINERGQIAATGTDATSGFPRALLLTPVNVHCD